jgi:hypothetical protein
MALNLLDITANNNDLTNVNTVTEVTTNLPFAQSTSAADFEASSSQYLHAADSASLSIVGNLTLEAWVKFESLPTDGVVMNVVAKADNGGNFSWSWGLINNSGTYNAYFTGSSDGTNLDILTTSDVTWTPSTGTWYHYAVVYSTAGEIKFYVNGAQQGATTTGEATSIFNGNAKLGIGVRLIDNGGPAGFFDGVIDDVRVWNTNRSEAQIAANRSIELTGTETNLVAYYPFETTIGSPAGGSFLLNFV